MSSDPLFRVLANHVRTCVKVANLVVHLSRPILEMNKIKIRGLSYKQIKFYFKRKTQRKNEGSPFRSSPPRFYFVHLLWQRYPSKVRPSSSHGLRFQCFECQESPIVFDKKSYAFRWDMPWSEQKKMLEFQLCVLRLDERTSKVTV